MVTQFPKIETVCSINGDAACIATFEANWASIGEIWHEQDATNQKPAFLFVLMFSGFLVRKPEVTNLVTLMTYCLFSMLSMFFNCKIALFLNGINKN